MDDWNREINDRIAEQVVFYRDMRSLSNEGLRARLAALGWDLTKNALSGILAGSRKRKTFPVHEVFLFAQALNVPPGELLTGATRLGRVRLSPTATNEATAIGAWRWIAGEADVRGYTQLEDDTMDVFQEAGDLLSMFNELVEHLNRLIAREYARRNGFANATEKHVGALLEDAQDIYASTRRAWPDADLSGLPLPEELLREDRHIALIKLMSLEHERL